MPATRGFAFATIGVNHGHIHDQTRVMQEAGCWLKSFYAPEDDLAAAYAEAFADARRVVDERVVAFPIGREHPVDRGWRSEMREAEGTA